MNGNGEVLNVIRVYWQEGFVYIVLEGEKMMRFSPNSEISGISLGNINFAVVEPKLFNFELLDGKRLHVTCPYTMPLTPTLGVFVTRFLAGFITL